MTKLTIALEGTPIKFRIQDHKMDAKQVVIKANHPEIASVVALAAGLAPGALTHQKGSMYYITFAPKAEFMSGLGTALANLMQGNVAIASFAKQTGQVESPVVGDLTEDEDDDGDEEEDYDGSN